MLPNELRYTPTHCWVRPEDDLLIVGLTDYAQEQMEELTFVELPDVDAHVEAEEDVAVVESVKAANEIYAPVAGTVVEVNESLLVQPELINQDPFGKGWLFKLRPDDLSDAEDLLDAEGYEAELPDGPE